MMKAEGSRILCLFFTVISELVLFSVAGPDREKSDSLRRLIADIEKKAHPDVPPRMTGKNDVDVNLNVGPLAVLDLNDASQMLTFRTYLMMFWRDEELVWDSANYSNIEKIQMSQGKLWTPLIALINQVDDVGHLESSVPVFLRSDGWLIWQTPLTASVTCKTDVSRYPFDSQTCRIMFTELDGYDINLTVGINDRYTHLNIETNGEWEVLELEAENNALKKRNIVIRLKRKNQFHILNFIFPMALLSLVNTLVFLLPACSGEKMGFLMAVFVSNAVFLTLIHDSMPSTSDSISNLSLYLLLIQIQGFLTIVATIAVQNVYHNRKSAQCTRQSGRFIKVGPCQEDFHAQISNSLCQDGDQHDVTASDRKYRIPVKDQLPLDRVLDRVFFVISLVCASTSLLWTCVRNTTERDG